jgi:hypothetical protein
MIKLESYKTKPWFSGFADEESRCCAAMKETGGGKGERGA